MDTFSAIFTDRYISEYFDNNILIFIYKGISKHIYIYIYIYI